MLAPGQPRAVVPPRRLPPPAVLFETLPFALFFLAVLPVAWALRGQPTARKVWLLAASYAFYGGASPRLLLLLFGASLTEWLCGEGVARARTERGRRLWLYASIAKNLGLLGVFKYYGFFRDNVEAIANTIGFQSGLPVLEILLPVGLSYITFQCIAYTVDLYRGHGVRAASLLDFLLFMAFFPQLLIGPICRSRDLLPQLEAPAPKGIPDLSMAVSLVLSGLFKKVVIATWLDTHLVQDAFLGPEDFSRPELLIATYAYTVLIYCDFSGYTDIARGIGLLLGFHLPDNFNRPYRSTNLAAFWRRWHMTFSNWLRDYIFLPLGGSRVGTLATWRNLMIVMLVTGIWHGAAWTFVIWGAAHGVVLVLYKFVQDRRRAQGLDPKRMTFPWWHHLGAWMLTFHFIAFARIAFRSPDVEVAGVYASRLVFGGGGGQGLEWPVWPVLALGMSLHFVGHHLRDAFVAWHDRLPSLARPVAWTVLAATILVLQPADVSPYLYFSF